MLTDHDVRKTLEESGALLSGHFVLSSGRHSEHYVQCAQVLQHPEKAEELGEALASRLAKAAGDEAISVVASPAIGGIVVGQELARALGVRHVFAERDASGKLAFRRGFSIERGETVVLAEDVVTTGGSVRELKDLVDQAGGRVLAIGALVRRGKHEQPDGVPVVALLSLDVADYDAADLPEHLKNVPVQKPGSRPTVAA